MFQFSVTEMMIVTTAVAVAAGGLVIPAHGNRTVAAVAAVIIGFTIAGPLLICRRQYVGVLRDRWGLGELTWFYLGLFFLPLPLYCLFSRPHSGGAERWLIVGFAMSAAICASALLIIVGKLILRVLGGYESSGREWFNRRPTNVAGLILIATYTLGGIGAIVFSNMFRNLW